jgi:hypothetical protein
MRRLTLIATLVAILAPAPTITGAHPLKPRVCHRSSWRTHPTDRQRCIVRARRSSWS